MLEIKAAKYIFHYNPPPTPLHNKAILNKLWSYADIVR